MTYFILITLPILMLIGLVGMWLSILPFLIVVIGIIYAASWLFG